MREPSPMPATDIQVVLLILGGLALIAAGIVVENTSLPITPITFQMGTLIVAGGVALGLAAGEPYVPRWMPFAFWVLFVIVLMLQYQLRLSLILPFTFAGVWTLGRGLVRIIQRPQY